MQHYLSRYLIPLYSPDGDGNPPSDDNPPIEEIKEWQGEINKLTALVTTLQTELSEAKKSGASSQTVQSLASQVQTALSELAEAKKELAEAKAELAEVKASRSANPSPTPNPPKSVEENPPPKKPELPAKRSRQYNGLF